MYRSIHTVQNVMAMRKKLHAGSHQSCWCSKERHGKATFVMAAWYVALLGKPLT